jgi:hypothetical protein
MNWQQLPRPHAGATPAFADPAAAQGWLATLAALPPAGAIAALGAQVDAVDGAGWSGPNVVHALNVLRAAAVPLHALVESDYARKPLPLEEGAERMFATAERFWRHLAIAYLRATPQCTPANRCLPLQRAAHALRLAQHTAFVAGRKIHSGLDPLFATTLGLAEANGVLDRPLADTDFPNEGKGTVSGQIAWALTLRVLDPYHLTLVQLPFANRLLRRWRELASLQASPGTVRRAHLIDIGNLLGCPLPPEASRYLNLRSISHKLAGRIQALEAGESPEELNLGRALSAAAALRMLKDFERHMARRARPASSPAGDLEVVFGAEGAYAVFKNRLLNATSRDDVSHDTDIYRRPMLPSVAQAQRTSAAPLKVAGEPWRCTEDGRAVRAAGSSGERHASPCLVSAMIRDRPRLGILGSLWSADDGSLSGEISWLEDEIEAGCLRQLLPRGDRQLRIPAFVQRTGDALSLILPPEAGARLGVRQDLAGMPLPDATPVEVIARGSDFVIYACTR